MSSENEETIRALIEKARRALSDAEVLLESGSAEATINRAYYAVFSATRAALLTKEETPSTHAGLIRRFGLELTRFSGQCAAFMPRQVNEVPQNENGIVNGTPLRSDWATGTRSRNGGARDCTSPR